MGAGIAQLGAMAGLRTMLHDAIPDGLERGVKQIETALDRMAAKGRLTAREAQEARTRLHPTASLDDFAGCGLVIEAVPEAIGLKRDLFAALSRIASPTCVFATNTSSLSVTEIAADLTAPDRVVGLHFFNPAPAMKLVELIAGEASGDSALALARAVAEAMGKHVVRAADIAGFLVNRCNRPYSLEALRAVQEGLATRPQIDRIARLAGGFAMGPFELMDLVGLDTNHAVAVELFRRTFAEPRYQPSELQARMVAARRLGRKTGRGWYDYSDGPAQPVEQAPPDPVAAEGRRVLVVGRLPVIGELRDVLAGVGFEVVSEPGDQAPWLTLAESGAEVGDSPRARLLAGASLHSCDPEAVGFHALPPLSSTRLIELTATAHTDTRARERLLEVLAAVGWGHEWVHDAPGLVLGRIVCQLINEAAFLLGERNASAADLDAGLELGVNHPRGPIAWSRAIGLEHVTSLLDALREESGESRYRTAPLLRRCRADGDGLRQWPDEHPSV